MAADPELLVACQAVLISWGLVLSDLVLVYSGVFGGFLLGSGITKTLRSMRRTAAMAVRRFLIRLQLVTVNKRYYVVEVVVTVVYV